MLFTRDLFDCDFSPVGERNDILQSDIKEAVEVGIELFESGDWNDILDLFSEYVCIILGKQSLKYEDQQLLVLVAYSKSNLAVTQSNFCLAGDWLLSAMNRCDPDNDLVFEQSIAYRYLMLAAAGVAGEWALIQEPSQVHVILSDPAFRELSIAYARLSPFGKARLDQATLQVATLRNRILDQLWDIEEFSNGRRRGAIDIAASAYQYLHGIMQSIENSVEHLVEETRPSDKLRRRGTKFIETVMRNKHLLLESECEHAKRSRDILGRPLTILAESITVKDPTEYRERIKDLADRASHALGRYRQGGLFAMTLCYPSVEHVRDIAIHTLGLTESAFEPAVAIRQTSKRYPP